MTVDVALPAGGWYPRDHQMALWDYLTRGGKRAVVIWHRRAGKDEVALHHAATEAMRRVGNYWHALPMFEQGRKSLWNAVNAHTGKRRIDEAFPPSIRKSTNETEMMIRLVNGSTWQVVGSDRYNAMVGSGPVGIVFSEYALANPSAWGYFRPMLEENDGWALFITTPRGRNHAKAIYDHAVKTPKWFAEIRTVEDTGALTPAQLAETKAELISLYGLDYGRAAYDQEYFCSFNAGVLGAYYAGEMDAVRREGRIQHIEPIAGQPVHTVWDLGVAGDTSIWWWQPVGAQVFIFDHYASSGVGVEHYRDQIMKRRREFGWAPGLDYVPHDIKVLEWGSGMTRIESMRACDLKPAKVRMADVEDGMNAVRRLLPICVFHPRCEEGGVSALEQYRREWDDEKKAFRANPVKDWTTHPADSFRYLAMIARPAPVKRIPEPVREGWRIPPPEERVPRRAPVLGGLRL